MITIDIGADSIKFTDASFGKEGYCLKKAAAVKTNLPSLDVTNSEQAQKITETIKGVLADAKFSGNQVGLSIPERYVYTQIIEFPTMTESELASAIPWEAENLIPQPLNEVALDWEVLEEEDNIGSGRVQVKKMKVLLVASQNRFVEALVNIVKEAGLIPVFVETELIALARYIRTIECPPNVMIANYGKTTLDIAAIKAGNLCLSRSIPTAGDVLTKAIATSLNLDISTAEEYKKTYGMTSDFEGKISSICKTVVDVAVAEIKKAVKYFEEKESEKIALVMLSGGSAVLPGLTEYLSDKVDIEVQLADYKAVNGTTLEINTSVSPATAFTTVVGLSLRKDI